MQITNKDELDAAIKILQEQKKEQQVALSVQFKETYEGLKPVNIIKKTIGKFTEPGDIRNTLLKAVGGIGTGLLTKGLLGGKATSVIGSMLGNVLKAGATNAFYTHADKLKAYGTAIYHNLFKKKK